MKIVLDKEKAEQIAEEVAQLREEVEKTRRKYDEDRSSEFRRERFWRALNAEDEFLRALYIIGVVGVKWNGEMERQYAFDLDEALNAIEEKGGAK